MTVRTLFAVAATTLLLASNIGQASAQTISTVSPKPVDWLAAGDSYSSGHGLPGAAGDCKTTNDAWPKLAEGEVQYLLPVGTFNFQACSGATTSAFAGQAGRSTYDIVTFTFGGDDIAFRPTLEKCILGAALDVALDPTWWLNGPVGCPSDTAVRQTISNLAGPYQTFLRSTVAPAVHAGGHVIVMGYPELIEDPGRWAGAAGTLAYCNGIGAADAARMRGWAGDLNATIGQAVHAADGTNGVHFYFVNVNDKSNSNDSWEDSASVFEPPSGARHNLCAGQPWINGLTSITQGFHPNEDGNGGYARLAIQEVRRLDWSGLAAPKPNPNPQPTPKPTASPTGGGQRAPTPGSPTVTLAQGPTAPYGYRYAVTLNGFPAGSTVNVTCYDSVSPGGFFSFPMPTDGSGNASTQNQCYSADGPEHWVRANGSESNHVSWGAPSQPPPTTPTPPATQPPNPGSTVSETSGGAVHTWTNYTNAGGTEGPTVPSNATIQISCKLQGFRVADGDTWWYRIAQSPWNGTYYGSADAFYNNGQTSGSLHGTPFVDPSVPDC
jgi:hypothetical protein